MLEIRGCSLGFHSGTTNLELCKRANEISIGLSGADTCHTARATSFHLAPSKKNKINNINNNQNKTQRLSTWDWFVHPCSGRSVCSKRICLVHFSSMEHNVWHMRVSNVKPRSLSVLRNTRRKRRTERPSLPVPSTDVTLLVAFTRRRGRAKFGTTLKCHLDYDTGVHVDTSNPVCICTGI